MRLLFLGLFIVMNLVAHATVYTSVIAGPLTTPATWGVASLPADFLTGAHTLNIATAVTSSNLSVSGSTIINVSATTGSLANTGTLTFSGTVALTNAGTVTSTGNLSTTSTGTSSNSGTMTITGTSSFGGGTFNNTGTFSSTSTVSVSAGFLTNSNSFTSGSTFTVSGTGDLNNTGGTLTVSGGGFTYSSSATSDNAGTMNVTGAVAISTGTFNNTGTFSGSTTTALSSGFLTNSGSFTSGTAMTVSGTGDLTNSAGTLKVTTGGLTYSSSATSDIAGTLNVAGTGNLSLSAGTVNISAGSTINSGNLTVSGGTVSISGAMSVGGDLSFSAGTTNISATVSTTAGSTGNMSMTNSSTIVNVNSGGTIDLNGTSKAFSMLTSSNAAGLTTSLNINSGGSFNNHGGTFGIGSAAQNWTSNKLTVNGTLTTGDMSIYGAGTSSSYTFGGTISANLFYVESVGNSGTPTSFSGTGTITSTTDFRVGQSSYMNWCPSINASTMYMGYGGGSGGSLSMCSTTIINVTNYTGRNDIDLYVNGGTVKIANQLDIQGSADINGSSGGGTVKFKNFNANNGSLVRCAGGTNLDNTSAAITSTTAGTVRSINLSTCGVLPITLVYFEGSNLGSNVILQWATAIEKNNKEFIIEKSSDGIEFHMIGSVVGAGNSKILTLYSYTDEQGGGYYRLKQVDFDGSYSYSNIIYVKIKSTISVYPNPVTDGKITIYISSEAEQLVKYELTDLNGKVHASEMIDGSSFQVYLPSNISGIHLLYIHTNDSLIIEKLIIK